MLVSIKEIVPSSLSHTALEYAVAEHQKLFQISPTTLCVSLYLAPLAYELLSSLGSHKMVVVPIPGLDDDTWFVLSPSGIVYSNGV